MIATNSFTGIFRFSLIFVVLILFSSVEMNAIEVSESNFYQETNHLGVVKNLVVDYGADGSDTSDDSRTLQNAIDEVTQLQNGGKIIIPEGIYYLADIQLKSNVHIEIDTNVTIIPSIRSDQKNYKIFNLDGRNTIIKNVSIRGVGGSFMVDLRNLENTNVGVFSCGNVENFLIANFYVEDDYTKFSAINFGISKLAEAEDGYNFPKKGVIKNGYINNAHYGYGLIQTQAARQVFFKNISGTGGVTLRFETGYDKMNELQVGGVFNMVARDVSCKNGNAALMISPHAIQNGKVDVDGVTAVNCGFAVRIGNGYVKKDQEALGLTPGSFEPSVVKNISATYGTSAQVKSKHFKYMPCNLRGLISDDPNHSDNKIYSGPSIASVLNQAEGVGPGKYEVAISNVSAIGFDSQPKWILYDEDTYDCPDEPTSCQKKLNRKLSVFPNPFTDKLNIRLSESHRFNNIQLLNAIGSVMIQREIDKNARLLKLSVCGLNMPAGLYFVKLNGNGETIQSKIIKRDLR